MSAFDDYNLIQPFKKRKMNYNIAYRLWFTKLAEKIVNLFTWEGLPFDQHELEIRAQMRGNGYTGVVYSSRLDRVIVANGSATGITEYPDKYINYTWTCPVSSGLATIGKDCVLVKNNSIMQPTRPLVQRYAHLLAHAELSLQTILINSRATGIIAARDQKQVEDIKEFYAALEDGRTMAIVDDDALDSLVSAQGLRSVSTAYPSSHTIIDYWQIRQNLYKEFLAEIGISKSTDKKERLITSEVAQDRPMYRYSLDDMLKCRTQAADQMGEVFGLDVSVDINPAIFEDVDETMDTGGASDDTDD